MWGAHVQKNRPSVPASYGHTTWQQYVIILKHASPSDYLNKFDSKQQPFLFFYAYNKTIFDEYWLRPKSVSLFWHFVSMLADGQVHAKYMSVCYEIKHFYVSYRVGNDVVSP